MSRDDRYPLEDQCLRCEPGTYLLDQTNFSACVRCPIGATCPGGSLVVANAGFWREPDNWSNPLSPTAGTSLAETARRWLPLPLDALIVSGSRRSGGSAEQAAANSTEAANVTVKRRPRRAVLHSCNPGSCAANNTCLKNFTGPACGVCPERWAKTSAGCEWCPAPDDPGMLLLKFAVYGVGGFLAFVGYIFACWTPLMEGLTLPTFIVSVIMLFSGIESRPGFQPGLPKSIQPRTLPKPTAP